MVLEWTAKLANECSVVMNLVKKVVITVGVDEMVQWWSLELTNGCGEERQN